MGDRYLAGFPLYLEMIYAMDKNYPGLFDKIVLVNGMITY